MLNNINISLITAVIITAVSILSFRNQSLFEKFVFSTGAILKNKDYYRIFSSMLVHVNLPHLFFNMFSFYSFAISIEMQLGYRFMLIVFFISGAAGSLLSLIINRRNLNYRAAGASGAVSGIIFSSVLLFEGSVYIMFVPVPVPSWLFAILFILISLYGLGREESGIGHDAHIGGALAGIIITWIYFPEIIQTKLHLTLLLLVPAVIYTVVIFFRRSKLW